MRWKIALLIVIFVASSAWAGKYVAEFLEIGSGVRAAGMGNAFIAINDDPSALWWNPASLGWIKTPQVYAMHALLYDQMYLLDAFASRFKVSKLSFGISLIRLSTDRIPFTRDDGYFDYGVDGIPGTGDQGEGNGVWDPGEPVDPSAIELRSEADYAGWLGIAARLSEKLALGANLKIIRQDIGGYTNLGYGSDLGAMYEGKNYKLAISLLDFPGTRLKWSTNFVENKLPTARIGGLYQRSLWGRGISGLAAFDLEMKFEGYEDAVLGHIGDVSFDPHVGLEVSFWNVFYLRGGLDRRDLSAGAGIRLGLVRIDYAFVASSIDNVHRIGLTVNFPTKKPPRAQSPTK